MAGKVVHIDDDVADVLGMSSEEIETLSVGDMIELALTRGHDIEIALRHSFDHGRMHFVLADPVER